MTELNRKNKCAEVSAAYGALITDVAGFGVSVAKAKNKDKAALAAAAGMMAGIIEKLENLEKYSAWNRWLDGQQKYEPEIPREVIEKENYEVKIHDELPSEAGLLRPIVLPGENIGLIAGCKILIRDESTGKYSNFLSLPEGQDIGGAFFLKNRRIAVQTAETAVERDESGRVIGDETTQRLSFYRNNRVTGSCEPEGIVKMPPETECCETATDGEIYIGTTDGKLFILEELGAKKSWKLIFEDDSMKIRDLKILPKGLFISCVDAVSFMNIFATIAIGESDQYSITSKVETAGNASDFQYSETGEILYGQSDGNIFPLVENNRDLDIPHISKQSRLFQEPRLASWRLLPDSRIITVSESSIKIWQKNRKGNYNVVDTVDVFDHPGWISVPAVMRDGRIVCASGDGKVDVCDGAAVKILE
jgi:outer membrane protein assembly factor BamB